MNETAIKSTAENAAELSKVIAVEATALQALIQAEDLYHACIDDEKMKAAAYASKCVAEAALVVLRARRNTLEDRLGLAD